MGVTLKDIAREVGLSAVTVSVALRRDNSSRISSETRERVREVAQRMGYKHNVVARMLRTGKSRLIGVILEGLVAEVHVAQLAAFNKLVAAKGYRALIRFEAHDSGGQREIVNELICNQVEGIVTFTPNLDTDCLRAAAEAKIPIVTTTPSPDVPTDSVIVDRFLGSYLAVKHLLDLGHRRIAILHVAPSSGLALRRVQGYLRALEEYDVVPDDLLMVNMGAASRDDSEAGRDAVQELLARKVSPTAVYCSCDLTAFGAIRGLQEAGLNVPDDVAVVGFDNVSFAEWSPIPLTTVAQPVGELAEALAEMLFRRIEHPSEEQAPQRVILTPQLIVRQSTVRDSRR